MNPLLNRLYSSNHRNYSSKMQTNKPIEQKRQKRIKSRNDRQLIPKVITKPKVQWQQIINNQRLKTIIHKTKVIKLPSVTRHRQDKNIHSLNSTLQNIKERKRITNNISNDFSSSYFATELQNYVQQNKITQQQPIKQIPRFIKSQNIIHYEESADQEEVFQYLKVIQEHEELGQQFCYMNRGQLPYSYYIVQYENRNRYEYITVSLRGITLIKGDQTQFTTIKGLSQQIQRYKKTKQIGFFKQYIKRKVFKHWLVKALNRKFRQKCKFVITNLFSQNPILKNYIAFLSNTFQDFTRPKIIQLHFIKPLLVQHLTQILNNKQTQLLEIITRMETNIYTTLKNIISQSLNKFRHDKRVTLGTNQIPQQPYIPFDVKKKNMKYTQMAKLKEFQGCMYRLIKLTDLQRFNLKKTLVQEALISYTNQLNWIYDNYITKKSASFVCWIDMTVTFVQLNKNVNLKSHPNVEEVFNCLREHRLSFVKNVLRNHQLLTEKKLELGIQNYEDDIEQKNNRLDLKYFIEKDQRYLKLSNLCDESLHRLTGLVQQHLDRTVTQILEIYRDSIEDVAQQMTNQWIKQYFQKNLKQRKIMMEPQEQIDFGLIYLRLGEPIKITRLKLQQKYKKVYSFIPIQVNRRCNNITQRLRQINYQFSVNPTTLRQYEILMEKYQQYQKQLTQIQKKIQQISDLQEIVKIGQNGKISLYQCTNYYKNLLQRFKIIESFQDKLRQSDPVEAN